MRDKYCLESVLPFQSINQSQTNRSRTKQTFSFSKSPRFANTQPKYDFVITTAVQWVVTLGIK